MNLAIICEPPGSGKEDLSAHAEQSAKDAFAYCPGPFKEMGFVRETPGSVARARQLGADWILFMRHYCLVDIQAFEEMGWSLKRAAEEGFDADMINFRRWSSAGPSTDPSRFWFQKSPFSKTIYPIEARRRILIEPEEPESVPQKVENAASPYVCQRPEFSWQPVARDCPTCVLMACPICGTNQRPPSV